jgi:molybdate transport system substrate-binding protein
VAAAADLSGAAPQLEVNFLKINNIEARFTIGASGMLARQIENGAPYDVFLSADEGLVRGLAASGELAPASLVTYAEGRLALWSRSGEIRTLADLKRPEIRHIAIANPRHAPYGVAARTALERQGLWAALSERVVYGENVRQALQFAETGNADAVLTAWSLVLDRGGILLPAGSYGPIHQMGGVVASSKHPREAAAFLAFLTGPAGTAILRRFGFN